jgi:uncharacterized protein (DUF58 family)
MTETASRLLSETTRARLMPLSMAPRRRHASSTKGERRSARRGTSIEFADYRGYTPGDDLRKLDWNVYARLNRPIVKLYEDEEDLHVHLLLDDSASMGPLAADAADKWWFARRLAAALGFVALNSNDRLTISALRTAGQAPYQGRGQAAAPAMLRHLAALEAGSALNAAAALRQFSLRERRSGMVFLLSDLMWEEGVAEGLNTLASKGHEVVVVHILAPEEIQPSLSGDLRLVDVETSASQEVTADSSLLAQYDRSLRAWLAETRRECARRRAAYVLATADTAPEAVVLGDLRRVGAVR